MAENGVRQLCLRLALLRGSFIEQTKHPRLSATVVGVERSVSCGVVN